MNPNRLLCLGTGTKLEEKLKKLAERKTAEKGGSAVTSRPFNFVTVLHKAKSNLETETNKISQQKKINEKIHKKINLSSSELHKKQMNKIEEDKLELQRKQRVSNVYLLALGIQ